MPPPSSRNDSTRVLVPVGALGLGARPEELEEGLKLGPHAIAVDAGSTDSGPAYLATGLSKYGREATKRDLALMMAAREKGGIPLLIGSCGTSGCDDALDWTLDLVLEIAREEGMRPKIAVLYSEQTKAVLKAKVAAGRVKALAPAGALDDATIDSCSHIVALLGPEPYIEALLQGADIVLGGRTTDTAVLAAVPLMRGAPAGPAWHAGKVAECGGVCTTNSSKPGVLFSVDADGFTIAPLDPSNRCTPETVSAHMLYENSDPFRLVEPGGVLDVTASVYDAIDARTVRVTGSRFEPTPYTMKLEGAGGGPFQTMMLVGIEDPAVLRDVDGFVARMHAALVGRVERTLGAGAGVFDISLRPYGWNAVSGLAPPPGRRSRARSGSCLSRPHGRRRSPPRSPRSATRSSSTSRSRTSRRCRATPSRSRRPRSSAAKSTRSTSTTWSRPTRPSSSCARAGSICPRTRRSPAMPKLTEVCRYVRSKNAGPFWVTVDLFFDGIDSYGRYHDHPAIGTESIARVFEVDPAEVKRFAVETLNVVKISYPRAQPQGGMIERDMHSGQQFVRLLELGLD